MDTLKSKIEVAVLGEYASIYKFCRAIDDLSDGSTEDRTAGLLASAIREWAQCTKDARNEYESIKRACTNNIQTLNATQVIHWEIDGSRVAGYNAKAQAQVQIIQTLCYIIGLKSSAIQSIFTVANYTALNQEGLLL